MSNIWTPDQKSDLDSHHIEGIAREGNTPFSVPLISHVDGNLWQGGCIGGVRLPDDFDFVVSLYPWEQYELGPTTARVEVRMYDAAEMPDERLIHSIGKLVADFATQGKTLVHCQAGLNRSGLIAGTAMYYSGVDPKDAITILRAKRSPAVLCNGAFERWLLRLVESPLPTAETSMFRDAA